MVLLFVWSVFGGVGFGFCFGYLDLVCGLAFLDGWLDGCFRFSVLNSLGGLYILLFLTGYLLLVCVGFRGFAYVVGLLCWIRCGLLCRDVCLLW